MAAAVISKEERDRLYRAECTACFAGREPVRREVYPGHWLWLHDSVATCAAHNLREQHRTDDAVAAQREKVPED